MTKRENLQKALCRYTTDTITYINTARGFCETISEWVDESQEAFDRMTDIKDRADKMSLKFSGISEIMKNAEVVWESVKSMVTNSRKELEEELNGVLKVTLGGLEELDCFVDAVEKLAVTSLHVFMEENQVIRLPTGIGLRHVQVVIAVARIVCPLLLHFKRDAKVFFRPKLQNVEVLSHQLDKYINTTKEIFEKMETSLHFPRVTTEIKVHDVDLTDEDVETMLRHIKKLDKIRMDPHFRMVFLFQEVSCSGFINEFRERQPRMQRLLEDLEEVAVELDKISRMAKVSNVAGSSVSAVGGVLSIVGLALIPVTAGVSVGLIIGGTAAGVTSAVNSAVTTAVECTMNSTQKTKASDVFQKFMKDVQSLQGYLEKVCSQPPSTIEASDINEYMAKLSLLKKARAVLKGIDGLIDVVNAAVAYESKSVVADVVQVVAQEGEALRDLPKVASEVPEISQTAVKGPLALSKPARVLGIACNAFFVGMDIVFICKDSASLAKGIETEVSQFLRARAALWSSEVDSWKKIHDSLRQGRLTSETKRAVLETSFYPRRLKAVPLRQVQMGVQVKVLCGVCGMVAVIAWLVALLF